MTSLMRRVALFGLIALLASACDNEKGDQGMNTTDGGDTIPDSGQMGMGDSGSMNGDGDTMNGDGDDESDAGTDAGSPEPQSLAAKILGGDLVAPAIEGESLFPSDLLPPAENSFPADLLPPTN